MEHDSVASEIDERIHCDVSEPKRESSINPLLFTSSPVFTGTSMIRCLISYMEQRFKDSQYRFFSLSQLSISVIQNKSSKSKHGVLY